MSLFINSDWPFLTVSKYDLSLVQRETVLQSNLRREQYLQKALYTHTHTIVILLLRLLQTWRSNTAVLFLHLLTWTWPFFSITYKDQRCFSSHPFRALFSDILVSLIRNRLCRSDSWEVPLCHPSAFKLASGCIYYFRWLSPKCLYTKQMQAACYVNVVWCLETIRMLFFAHCMSPPRRRQQLKLAWCLPAMLLCWLPAPCVQPTSLRSPMWMVHNLETVILCSENFTI